MSGFQTAMFVPTISHGSPRSLSPIKPQPLQPIFTFAQSHTCMNPGPNPQTEPTDDHTYRKLIREGFGKAREAASDLVKPQLAYKSPLQKLGEALRIPQASSLTTLPIPDVRSPVLEAESSTKPFVNESPSHHHQIPVQRSPSHSGSMQHIHDFGQACDGAADVRLNNCSDSTTHTFSQQHRDYSMIRTSLRSFPFSNPRPRAPFKPQKSSRGTSSWQLKQYAEATLGSGSLRKAVKLPEGEDKDEWLAVNGKRDSPQNYNWD